MRLKFWAIAGAMVLAILVMPPAKAQIPFLPSNLQLPSLLSSEADNRVVAGWILLDGHRVFQIAAPKVSFAERFQNIQQNLDRISQDYLQRTSTDLQVQVRELNGLPVIYVNNQYLLTVTGPDAKQRQEDPPTSATEISQVLQQYLQGAKQERKPEFLTHQSGIAIGTGLTMILISWMIHRQQRRSRHLEPQPIYPTSPAAQPIATQLNRQQHRNLKEVQQRLFQLAQAVVWASGTIFILDLFPYTRPIQVWIFAALEIPLRLGIVALATYVSSRLSYALIDRFTSALVGGALLTPETSQRLQLRVSTVSVVTKSIATGAYVTIALLIALTTLGINIGPLLAGAGLIGVVVSLASQSIIKDAMNGFLIIMEDQYALGDVIAVGNVGGLVENLNLRITQIRDSEGRLITIPNSEIKIVANLSSRWSRADLSIPVAYNADIDAALKLIETVTVDMDHDPQWQDQILETEVLGIDNFADRGLMIRVWIKTQPLKQWDVAREYRRRIKVAFDQAGILIPLPQQSIWVNDAQSIKSPVDGISN